MKTKKILYLLVIAFTTCALAVHLSYLSIFPFVYKTTMLNKAWSSQLKDKIQDISVGQNRSIIVVMKNSMSLINSSTGKEIWTTQLPSNSTPYPALFNDGKIFIATENSLLSIDGLNGSVLWKQSCNCYYSKILDVSHKYILVNTESDSLNAYSAISGKLIWTLRADRGFVEGYISDDTVYVIDKEVSAINAVTGEIIWKESLDIKGDSFFSNGTLVYESGNLFDVNTSYIASFDVNKRKVLWQTPMRVQGITNYMLYNQNLFATDQDYIYAFDVKNGNLLWKSLASDSGNISIAKNNVIILGEFNRTISVFNTESGKGKIIAQIDLPQLLGSQRQEMLVIEDIIVFLKKNTIYAYRLISIE